MVSSTALREIPGGVAGDMKGESLKAFQNQVYGCSHSENLVDGSSDRYYRDATFGLLSAEPRVTETFCWRETVGAACQFNSTTRREITRKGVALAWRDECGRRFRRVRILVEYRKQWEVESSAAAEMGSRSVAGYQDT